MDLLLVHERFSKIKQAFREEQHQQENIQELLRKLLNDLQVLNGILLERGDHAAQIKLDEVIKSSVEDLVPISSEFEDTSGSYNECVLPSCDYFSSINVFEEKVVTFSNPLFNSNDDFTSSDDESLSDEDDEYFTPGDDVELLLHHDPSTPIMSVASILEGFTDKLPLEENDDLFDLESKNNKWKMILYNALIDDLITEDKVFDPGIHDKFFSPTYVSLPLTDRHYIFFTYVVRIFLPHFTYPVVSPFLLSSESEDTIFDPGIFAFHFSHRSRTFISFNVYPNILNENQMEIFSSICFNPNITMIRGESS
nr:hypothetical protein [Tanacetum cinerariifolium]